jgi:choice-of-anchor A domain-containing protein
MRTLLAAALAGMAFVQPVAAATPIVGTAALNEWNVIVLNNFSGTNAHVHGRAFVGGSISGTSDFNMDATASTRGQPGLTVVGNVTGSSNKVWGGATIGGSAPDGIGLNGANQTVKVGGTMPAVNINGNTLMTNQAANPTYINDLNTQRSALVTSMIALSDALKALTPTTGTAGVTIASNRATFTATGSGLNVINLNGSSLANFGEISFANAGPTVVNVSGTDILLNDNFLGASQALGEKVIWNFYQATNLTMSNAFYGSILAPRAKATVNQDIYGTLIVDTLGMNGEAHLQTFNGNLPNVTAVPEPASWAMMISGFGLIGAGLRRRRATAALA